MRIDFNLDDEGDARLVWSMIASRYPQFLDAIKPEPKPRDAVKPESEPQPGPPEPWAGRPCRPQHAVLRVLAAHPAGLTMGGVVDRLAAGEVLTKNARGLDSAIGQALQHLRRTGVATCRRKCWKLVAAPKESELITT